MASAKENAVQISEPRVEEHPAMVVAGVSRVFSLDEDFSPLWDELNQKASPAMLDVLNVTQYLGVCTQPNPKGQVRYTAGFLVSEPASAAKLGLGVLELPASTYAVVEVTGPISESIRLALRALRRRSSRRIRSTARLVAWRFTAAAICRRLITVWNCGFRWRSVPNVACFCGYSCSFGC